MKVVSVPLFAKKMVVANVPNVWSFIQFDGLPLAAVGWRRRVWAESFPQLAQATAFEHFFSLSFSVSGHFVSELRVGESQDSCCQDASIFCP